MTELEKVLKACRELTLDLSPVKVFSIQKQGFVFKVEDQGITLGTENELTLFTFSDLEKLYELVNKIKIDYSVDVSLNILYNPLEYSEYLVRVEKTLDENKYYVQLQSYFSDDVILSIMSDFFNHFYPYYADYPTREEFQAELSGREMYDLQKVALWVAFYMIEAKRKNIAANAYNIANLDGELDNDDFYASDMTVTTKIGNSFTVVEEPREDAGTKGFTDLWNDADKFLAKLQLYIRGRYEKLFGDYSLRNNSIVSVSTTLIKDWKPYEYAWQEPLSEITKHIIVPTI